MESDILGIVLIILIVLHAYTITAVLLHSDRLRKHIEWHVKKENQTDADNL